MTAAGFTVYFRQAIAARWSWCFSWLEQHAHVAIMVTASTNPPATTRDEVYSFSGGQVVQPPHDCGHLESVLPTQDIRRTELARCCAGQHTTPTPTKNKKTTNTPMMSLSGRRRSNFGEAVLTPASPGPRDFAQSFILPLHGGGANASVP